MEETRKRKQYHCVHIAEDGIECGKSIQHWSDRLCRRHFHICNGVFSRTPQRRNAHARNDAPTSNNGLLQSHSSRRHPIQEEKEEEEEKNGEEEEDEEEEEGSIASPSMTGAITSRSVLMTTTTTMTMTNTATVLPFLEVNNVRQAQADQECQQQMSTTKTMTAIAMAALTPPVPPPMVIQPMLPSTLNDNLPCNINVPTSSHIQSEFQVRDGRINAMEIELLMLK